MSEQNLELVRRAYDAFNRRDWDGFAALIDESVVVESRLVVMEGGYRGLDGLRRWWDDLLNVFPDYTAEIEELRDLGDVTLGYVRGGGRSDASGTPVLDPFWHAMDWVDGKCVWWRNCTTEAEALQAMRSTAGATKVGHVVSAGYRTMRRLASPIALVVLLALAPAAQAGTADIATGPFTYVAKTTEVNVLTVAPSICGQLAAVPCFVVTDSAGVTASARCQQVSPTQATCPSDGITSYSIRLDDLDDTAALTIPIPGTLDGGDGNDRLAGGTGADAFVGGPGTDTADWSGRTQPVIASIDGAANDGEAGEGDNVGTDVELTGGTATTRSRAARPPRPEGPLARARARPPRSRREACSTSRRT